MSDRHTIPVTGELRDNDERRLSADERAAEQARQAAVRSGAAQPSPAFERAMIDHLLKEDGR